MRDPDHAPAAACRNLHRLREWAAARRRLRADSRPNSGDFTPIRPAPVDKIGVPWNSPLRPPRGPAGGDPATRRRLRGSGRRLPRRSRQSDGRESLSSVTPGHERLYDCVARGLDAAAKRLAAGTRLELQALELGTLADLDRDSVAESISADRIAGVVQRFAGQLCGTALLALDPGDALQWLRIDADDDPLARFVLQGGRVLSRVVDELARGCDAALEFGPAHLEERPLLAALLSTHAPSDTALLSLSGELEFPGGEGKAVRAAYTIQVLLEPKLLAGVLLRLRDDG